MATSKIKYTDTIGHPNFSNVLKTFSGGSTESYTPTVDAWVIGNLTAPTGASGFVNLQDIYTVAWTSTYCGVCIPVKAGTKISILTNTSNKPVVYASY